MLNYHHLRIFHAVAREGGLRQAANRLHLTQPTISAQIHLLEETLGEALFFKAGRRLALTAAGRMALEYAEEIFSLGGQLESAFAAGLHSGQKRLRVGIVNSLPKLLVRELLRPVLDSPQDVRLICQEAPLEDLVLLLAGHRLDLVLADEPVSGDHHPSILNQRLGKSAVALCGGPTLARKYRRRFPAGLDGAPVFLPSSGMPLRRALDAWFLKRGLVPHVLAEFDDTALMKDFAADGTGLVPVLMVAVPAARKRYGWESAGTLKGMFAEYFALYAARSSLHPALREILGGPGAE